MDRRFKAWTMPGMEDLGSALGVGTVIDGEVVRNRSWERDVFMCFDLLSVERESVVRVPLQQRLKRLQQDILGQRYLKYLTAHDETVDMRMKTLPLIMKHFYPTKQVGEVLRHIGPEGSDRVYLEKSQEGKPNPSRKRHHKSDGLIFAPNLPYHRGTDFNYMKWKWHDTITLDFEATRSFSAKYGVAVAFDAQDSKVDFTEHIVLSPQEKYRLLGDLGQQNMIITEWEYSPSEGAWVYKMPRPDKKKSNFARTVLSTMMELAEAMDVEEVEYRLSFSNPEEDNWEVANKAKRTEMVAARRRGAKANGGAAH
ncbi:hypothetical protein T484DRAFT_2691649 [Baffinella frigidus]|nr:hypothetical protein T484DRAFT_2691649 [Cryptophyta sp. CCMP2293]